MQVENVELATLLHDPANVRQHDVRNLDAIKASLKRFGQQKPIVVDGDGIVVAGNGTLAAFRELGWSQIDIVRTELKGAEAIAYAIADNRTAELANWDDSALAQTLTALRAEDPSLLQDAGFLEDEFAKLLDFDDDDAPQQDFANRDFEDDVLPEAPEPITQPGDVIELGNQRLICGDCIEEMRKMPDSSVDAVVTDPPYGLGVMGNQWDCSVPGPDFATEALRVLKPGGHLIAFAATRTVHRLAVALEDSGFEIRDMIGWLQWQGFPKSVDVSKKIDEAAGAERKVVGSSQTWSKSHKTTSQTTYGSFDITEPATDDAQTWSGWGTALKPAQEPALLCRKPLQGTTSENVLKWGTGALNIDGCRIGQGDPAWPGPTDGDSGWGGSAGFTGGEWVSGLTNDGEARTHQGGRWPANIYYCPKPTRSERDEGCEEFPKQLQRNSLTSHNGTGNFRSVDKKPLPEVGNFHPTVKPVHLMRWLVRLVTPPGGIVLEPFAGSGTTLLASEREGFTCVGIEREPSYCDIVRARLDKLVGS